MNERVLQPQFHLLPREPCPAGREWDTMVCAMSNIIFAIEAVLPKGSQPRLFDEVGKMVGIVLRLCETADLFKSKPRVVVGDSAFAKMWTDSVVRQLPLRSEWKLAC